MVIVRPSWGLGNQLYQYACARELANRLNTELKIDLSKINSKNEVAKKRFHEYYKLDSFNIQAQFATPDEIKHVQENAAIPNSYELENVTGDTIIQGHMMFHKLELLDSIVDVNALRKEFTLKKPFSPTAKAWEKMILSDECSVSMHFRQGDYRYFPKAISWAPILPLDYYYTCIDILKQRYDNIRVFVFSNNLPWVKENLYLDVPTEFIENCETDLEEFALMSLCKHNICAYSTFSEIAAWLNQNPDKKVFLPHGSHTEIVQKYLDDLTSTKKNSILDSGTYIRVPYDLQNQPEITQRPIFSLLLIVNNDVGTIYETLESLINQDYKYYEIIIIDNASTDDSSKICRQAIKNRENVKYKRLRKKVNNSVAWNRAFNMAQGDLIFFLKSGDRFLVNTLTTLMFTTFTVRVDIIQLFSWLEEDENGAVIVGEKKYSEKRDVFFQEQARTAMMSANDQDFAKLLLDQQINQFLGAKIFHRNFLVENGIKFDENLADEEAELFFQIECFFKAKNFMYVENAFYIAPKDCNVNKVNNMYNDNAQIINKFICFDCSVNKVNDMHDYNAQIINKFSRFFTARIDIKLIPKTEEGDFQILSTSDEKASVIKPGWFQKGGVGYVIHSYVGKLKIVTKATADGQIQLNLRGMDIRQPDDRTKRIPYWIDYIKLIVNGQTIFHKLTPAWHDNSYSYNWDAKADEEITVEVEWIPHRSDT